MKLQNWNKFDSLVRIKVTSLRFQKWNTILSKYLLVSEFGGFKNYSLQICVYKNEN